MNGKQLRQRETRRQKSLPPATSSGRTKLTLLKGVGLCAIAALLLFVVTKHSGQLINSPYPMLDNNTGQFAAVFFASFAGVCGLDLIRKS